MAGCHCHLTIKCTYDDAATHPSTHDPRPPGLPICRDPCSHNLVALMSHGHREEENTAVNMCCFPYFSFCLLYPSARSGCCICSHPVICLRQLRGQGILHAVKASTSGHSRLAAHNLCNISGVGSIRFEVPGVCLAVRTGRLTRCSRPLIVAIPSFPSGLSFFLEGCHLSVPSRCRRRQHSRCLALSFPRLTVSRIGARYWRRSWRKIRA